LIPSACVAAKKELESDIVDEERKLHKMTREDKTSFFCFWQSETKCFNNKNVSIQHTVLLRLSISVDEARSSTIHAARTSRSS
jgi:hypothetical protein